MGKLKTPKHQFTKDEIKKVYRLWEGKSTLAIAEELGLKEQQITYIATQMRKSGLKMAKKHKIGYLRNLIEEVKLEMTR